MLSLSPTLARRLAIARQRLAGPRPPANAASILDAARDLGCLQLDPISVVARSHLLVLWSRFGVYDPAHLENLLWRERRLFEYWAHVASIVLTEDYPIHQGRMRDYASGDAPWEQRTRAWVQANDALRQRILARLREAGPMLARDFKDKTEVGWISGGWTTGRNVNQMLDYLWARGEIMVAGRSGLQKLWDLSERCLPDWTPRQTLSECEIVHLAAQRSLRALGVARPVHIRQHFIRRRYPNLTGVLADLEAGGRIAPAQIKEGARVWPGRWYIHTDDLPLLERLAANSDGCHPRTTLLSPFDNLICDRKRTEMLFNFKFRTEIYVPKEKRQYGYYVMPILHGDQLIGRVDPAMDRKRGCLTINAVYAEPTAPLTPDVGRAVAGAIEDLGRFLGAREIVFGRRVPKGWKRALVAS